MVGRVSGVAAWLKHHNPQILSIHCINHRLALGTSQAAVEVPYLVKFQEILVNIFKFYHYSDTRQSALAEIQSVQSALAEIQSVLNDPQLKFKEPKSVCWLSHALVINAIKHSLPSLLCSLEREASERSDPAAMGLSTLCKTYMFIATLLFMSDIHSHVTKISLLFQSENVDYSQVQKEHALKLSKSSPLLQVQQCLLLAQLSSAVWNNTILKSQVSQTPTDKYLKQILGKGTV